jgi:hypothetical protein
MESDVSKLHAQSSNTQCPCKYECRGPSEIHSWLPTISAIITNGVRPIFTFVSYGTVAASAFATIHGSHGHLYRDRISSLTRPVPGDRSKTVPTRGYGNDADPGNDSAKFHRTKAIIPRRQLHIWRTSWYPAIAVPSCDVLGVLQRLRITWNDTER